MILEDIEQKVLLYLKQVTNPVVKIGVLLAHLREEEEFAPLTEPDLVDFLKHHELFRLIEPGGPMAESEMLEAFSRTGLLSSPCVILHSRVPTEREMAVLMREELARMKETLATALASAREAGDNGAVAKLQETLDRMETLHLRFGTLAQGL